MLRTTLAGLRSHARRLIATTLAIVFGVAFLAGTFFFRDTATAGFYDTYARSAHGVDAVVESGQTDLTDAQVTAVKAVSGVDAVDARRVQPLAMLDAKGKAITNFGRVGFTISADGDARLRGFDVTGRVPSAPGEALLDNETAARQRIAIGGTITVLDQSGAKTGTKSRV